MSRDHSVSNVRKFGLLVLAVVVGLVGGGLIVGYAAAPDHREAAQDSPPPHPAFPLLDDRGENVLESGGPLSLLATCDGCHDAGFIDEHNQHAGLVDQLALPGQPQDVRFDPELDQFVDWDAQNASGVEINCLLCHAGTPNNSARLQALSSEDWEWANTATLLGSGAVSLVEGSYQWNPSAFDNEGNVAPELLGIQTPLDTNCALCHSMEPLDPDMPITASS
jgi:hypothetical protein